MRDNAEDTDLPRRIDGSGDTTVPAASAAASSASSADGDVPGRNGDAGGLGVPDSATAATATAGAQARRTRIILSGPASVAPALFLIRTA
jgi:hypothetical protein